MILLSDLITDDGLREDFCLCSFPSSTNLLVFRAHRSRKELVDCNIIEKEAGDEAFSQLLLILARFWSMISLYSLIPTSLHFILTLVFGMRGARG